MKRAAITADIFGTTLTVTFANGKDLSVDVLNLSPEIQRAAMLHGIKQKLVDAAAIARNTETGASATIDDKYSAVKSVFDRVTAPNGTWNKEREAVASNASGNTLLVRALMRMTGKDKDYVDDFLSAKTKEQRAALKKNPRVLAIIAELQAASAPGDIDTDELLGELGAHEPESDDTPADDVTDEQPAEPVAITPQLAQPTAKKPRSKKAAVAA
jgi:hypothetical protein